MLRFSPPPPPLHGTAVGGRVTPHAQRYKPFDRSSSPTTSPGMWCRRSPKIEARMCLLCFLNWWVRPVLGKYSTSVLPLPDLITFQRVTASWPPIGFTHVPSLAYSCSCSCSCSRSPIPMSCCLLEAPPCLLRGCPFKTAEYLLDTCDGVVFCKHLNHTKNFSWLIITSSWKSQP